MINHLEVSKRLEQIELEIKQLREKLTIDGPAWTSSNAVIFELNNLMQNLKYENLNLKHE